SFVPRLPGAPPIEGRARDIVLDVFGAPPTGSNNEAVSGAGRGILAFLGLEVVELGEQGLRVVNVLPDKPAFEAGIRPSDRIVAWSNLRVHRSYDLEPFPG